MTSRSDNLASLVLSSRERLTDTAWRLLVFISSEYGHAAFRISAAIDDIQQSDEFASYSPQYLRKLMYELVAARVMSPISDHGWYRLGDESMKAGPYHKICRLSGGAVAHHTALYYHGLTDHYPRSYYARTLRTLPGDRTTQTVDGIPLFISIARSETDYELGLETHTDKLGDSFSVTSSEKTYLDLLRAPQKAEAGFSEIMSSFVESREELDLPWLCRMAIRLRSKALLKRVGYMLEYVGREDLIRSMKLEDKSYQRNWTRLDLSHELGACHDRRWHLDVNVDTAFQLERLGVGNAGVARPD